MPYPLLAPANGSARSAGGSGTELLDFQCAAPCRESCCLIPANHRRTMVPLAKDDRGLSPVFFPRASHYCDAVRWRSSILPRL